MTEYRFYHIRLDGTLVHVVRNETMKVNSVFDDLPEARRFWFAVMDVHFQASEIHPAKFLELDLEVRVA